MRGTILIQHLQLTEPLGKTRTVHVGLACINEAGVRRWTSTYVYKNGTQWDREWLERCRLPQRRGDPPNIKQTTERKATNILAGALLGWCCPPALEGEALWLRDRIGAQYTTHSLARASLPLHRSFQRWCLGDEPYSELGALYSIGLEACFENYLWAVGCLPGEPCPKPNSLLLQAPLWESPCFV